jgi:GH24 family phage-related lysozyme (muramidase)
VSLKTKIVGALAGSTLLGSALLTSLTHLEGTELVAYFDSAGVLTICNGDTTNVQKGQRASLSECKQRLKDGIAKHANALQGLPQGIPDVVILGAVSNVYNIGEYGFDSSSQKKCLARGDYACAKAATLKWKYITVNGRKYDCSTPGNKVCRGLWERRQWEARAMGNEFKTVQEALAALPK